MEFNIEIWLEYLLRFSHLVTGIAWIGSSFYFIWLDSSFLPPETPRKNVEGELFMVHGGFYYQVDKKKIFPGELPKILHWFKWEATLTWVTGFLLLIVLYFFRDASLLIDNRVYPFTQVQAIMTSLSLMILSWFVYDFIWTKKIIKSNAISSILSILFFSGLIFLNTNLFSGRGAYILTGAIFGSLMLLNVWIRILPGQTKMLKEAQAGQVPDYSVSLKSKIRSVHNTYFTFPVLFIMLSNHYAFLYNHEYKAWVLILLCVVGALTRHAMVTKNNIERWVLLPAVFFFGFLIYMSGSYKDSAAIFSTSDNQQVTFEQVEPIFKSRCVSCHSAKPTDDLFREPPKNLILETEEQILKVRDDIHFQVVVVKVMPFANKTEMTDGERELMGRWLKQAVQ